jgi:nucleoside-diphosphate-sugar epimerase
MTGANGMKVLVTGANGFTGSHLAHALLAKGYQVHAFVRDAAKLNGLVTLGAKPVTGDLTDRAAVARAVKGVDAVYHIAAAYRDNLPYQALHAANVEGTRHLLDAALENGVKRFVHCSTAGVHGHVETPPATEDSPLAPGDDYQKTKLEGEQLAATYVAKGLPVAIFRPVGIHGPGDLRFLKLFKTIKNGKFIMFGDGNVLYHLTYVEDVVRGAIACGEHPNAVGKTYLVAGPPAVTLTELVRRIAALLSVDPPKIRLPFGLLYAASVACEALCMPLGVKPPLFRRRADWFRKDRSFDASKIQRELGVVPQVSLEEGLRRTADWYREKGYF